MKTKIKVLFLISILLIPISAFADQIFFYHTDPAGTPLAMTDSSGNVVWRADYKPFGEENTIAESQENDKRFVGKEKDEETGHYYFGARYMDPKTGRFIAVDPVRAVDPRMSKTNEEFLLNPQRLNPYAYALNNPYRYVDPDGKETMAIITRDRIFGISYGSHSALRVDNPLGGGPVLYDPGGRVYNPKDEYGGPLRGSHDNFEGGAADLAKYKAAQEATGSKVETYRFNTTPEQEKQIAERIEKIGGGFGGGLCTIGVCNVIQGVGPFKDVGTYVLPGNLADKLKELKKD